MALIRCPICTKKVSDTARRCPKCQAPEPGNSVSHQQALVFAKRWLKEKAALFEQKRKQDQGRCPDCGAGVSSTEIRFRKAACRNCGYVKRQSETHPCSLEDCEENAYAIGVVDFELAPVCYKHCQSDSCSSCGENVAIYKGKYIGHFGVVDYGGNRPFSHTDRFLCSHLRAIKASI